MATMEASGAIVVAIPTLDEAVRIAEVVAQLLVGLPADRPVRLVVADGGSRDATRAIVADIAAHDPRVALVANPGRLQSAGVNRVAAGARGDADVLVRADAHTDYPPGFVAAVADALDRTGADAVVVPMDSIGAGGCTARAIAWVSDSRLGSGGSAHRGGRASGWIDHGHHAGWRLDAFLAAGGYDESYSHNEDAELDCRLAGLSRRVWLDAGIRLRYRVRPTLAALWRQYQNYGRGRSRTVRRHPGSMRARQLAVPLFVAANAAALAAAPFAPAMLVLPLAYVAILALVSLRVAVARRSACGLLAGAAAGVMHVAWAVGFAAGLATMRESRWRAPSVAAT